MEFKRLYRIIKNEAEAIKSLYSYKDLSGAFGHLFLKMLFELSDDECREAYTDGGDDNGIDAIYFKETNCFEIHFFQFKFPGSEETINKAVTQDEVLKIFNGARVFISNSFNDLLWNEDLKSAREYLDSVGDRYIGKEKYIIHIVRFTSLKASDMQNTSVIKENIASHKRDTGIEFILEEAYAAEIDALYQKYAYFEWPTIQLHYSSRSIEFDGGNSKTSLYYVSLFELYDKLNDKTGSIFEGNVRYFLGQNLINKNIIKTLEDSDECQNFHLLNNGITIVCDKYDNQDRNNLVSISKCSIINGAQTIGSIISTIETFLDEGKSIEHFKNSFALIKVINVFDRNSEMINKLVLTLNTQNPMARSYRVSNDASVRKIKDYVYENSEYILISKRNEFEHLKSTNPSFSKAKDNCFDIETALKICVSFENIKGLASEAKRRMSILFKDDNIDEILDSLDGDKLINYFRIYKMINRVINGIRSILYDSVPAVDKSFLEHGINKNNIYLYRFASLADTLIMFAIGEYCRIRNKDITSVDLDFVFSIIRWISPLYQNYEIYNFSRSSLAFISVTNLILNNMDNSDDTQMQFNVIFLEDLQNAILKKENISEETIGKLIYSLANTKGGHLYIGVDEGQIIQGLTEEEVETIGRILDSYKAIIELTWLQQIINSKIIIVVWVTNSDEKLLFEGKYLMRFTNGSLAETPVEDNG